MYESLPAVAKFNENRKRAREEEFIEIISFDTFLERCLFEYTKPPIGSESDFD